MQSMGLSLDRSHPHFHSIALQPGERRESVKPLPLLRGAPNATEAWRRERRKRRRPDRGRGPSEWHLCSDRHAPAAVPSVKAQDRTDHTIVGRQKKLHLKWRPLVEDVCCTTYVIASGTDMQTSSGLAPDPAWPRMAPRFLSGAGL